MSLISYSFGETVTDRSQLVRYLEDGCKKPDQWLIGTEHEKFVFRLSDLHPLPYEGKDGIKEILIALQEFGWESMYENESNLIGLQMGQKTITLEPGGQFELSGAPVATLHDCYEEITEHLRQIRIVGAKLGIGMMGLGFQPKWSYEQTPWMPKKRYYLMQSYMSRSGSLGLDVMARTCTVQVNLDYCDEKDMVRKFRVSYALQPIVTALFANSPFSEGIPNGFQSYRASTWQYADPIRCEGLDFVFEEGFGFERYVDYAVKIPMYYVARKNGFINASGLPFEDFLNGRLSVLPGEVPFIEDWSNHLKTIFTDVRLKQFLEMRGSDCGLERYLYALPALWVGLLYDSVALDAAWDIVKDWTAEERDQLRREVPKYGLKTPFRRLLVHDIARTVVEIAFSGLRSRQIANDRYEDETHYLDALVEVIESGETEAQKLLNRYHTAWNGNIDYVFQECRY